MKVDVPIPPQLGRVQALEMQNYWKKFFESEDYRTKLKDRINKGKAIAVEILMYNMVYGKPKETLALQGGGDGTLTLIIGGQTQVELTVDEDGLARRKVVELEPGQTALALPEKAQKSA